jgi:formate/nitrite transporter
MDPQPCNAPPQIAEAFSKTVCVKKANAHTGYLIVLGFLAGAFIAFGGLIAILASFESAKFVGTGLSKIIGGAVFSVGLMMVVIGGAELFTGNNLIVLSTLSGEVKWGKLIRNWIIVFFANFAGALFVAWLYYQTGLWKTVGLEATDTLHVLGLNALKTAVMKVNLTFMEGFTRGVFCNWIVCMAVWMAAGAKDIIGKVFAIFFPIMTFVALGFEHSIANMFFIPLGIFLANAPQFVGKLVPDIFSAEKMANLNINGLLMKNLLPVTLGNIIGGAFFVGFLYWFVYLKGAKKTA